MNVQDVNIIESNNKKSENGSRNDDNSKAIDEALTLHLLEEIEKNEKVSQRSLSNKLGVALGLVNTYIKYLVKKGFIRITQFPKSRYAYLLTTEGFAEKSRLVYKHLSYYNNLFKTVRNDTLNLFKELENKGVKTVGFVGVDEVAEIAYLSLQETKITLTNVYDDEGMGENFFKVKVEPLENIKSFRGNTLILTKVKNAGILIEKAKDLGYDTNNIIDFINKR